MLKALYGNAERRGIRSSTKPRHRPHPRAWTGDRRRGRTSGEPVEIRAGAVVLACGSFESNPRCARAISGPAGSWPRSAARASTWGRPRHGAGDRRAAATATGRAAIGRVGHQRAALWRPRDRRPVPEAQLSVRASRQRQGRALRRRGLELPQPHLRQVRRRDHEPAGMFAWQVFDAKGTISCAASTASGGSPRPRRTRWTSWRRSSKGSIRRRAEDGPRVQCCLHQGRAV